MAPHIVTVGVARPVGGIDPAADPWPS